MLGYAVHEEVVVRDHHQAPLELLTQILLQRGERAQVWDRYTKVVSEKRYHGLSLTECYRSSPPAGGVLAVARLDPPPGSCQTGVFYDPELPPSPPAPAESLHSDPHRCSPFARPLARTSARSSPPAWGQRPNPFPHSMRGARFRPGGRCRRSAATFLPVFSKVLFPALTKCTQTLMAKIAQAYGNGRHQKRTRWDPRCRRGRAGGSST
jgi:hypothetical protein